MDWRHGGKDLYWVQHVGVDTWTQIKREHPRRLLSNTGLVSEEQDGERFWATGKTIVGV